MRPRRGLLVLAIVAALWGAPSVVSAAANELSSPQVSPGSGSVATVFAFRVRYDGAFPATSVVLDVAGRSVPMALQSGSLRAGWWSASALLPSGAWSTTFHATSTRGPTPAISGPAVIVADTAAPSPSSGSSSAPTAGTEPESGPATGLDGPTAPPAAPVASPQEAAATATAVASADPASSEPESTSGGSGGSDAPAEVGTAPTPMPAEATTRGGGASAPSGHGVPAASPSTVPTGGAEPALIEPASDRDERDARARTDEMVSDLLLIGLAGVASVAIIGTLLLVAGRRREPGRVPADAAAPVAGEVTHRRLARFGRMRASDDPIIAALGVDDEMAARRAIRSARRAGDEGAPRRDGPAT